MILYNPGFVPGPRDFSIHSIIFGIVLLLNELRYSNQTGAKSKCAFISNAFERTQMRLKEASSQS